MSKNRPLNIPGRRKVITKNMILEAQKHTKSNMVAKWMGGVTLLIGNVQVL